MLAGSAFSITRSRSMVVEDISEGGASLVGHDLPRAGDDMLMIVGQYDEMARVVWQSGDKCGIRFDEAIDPELLKSIKKEASWASICGWAH